MERPAPSTSFRPRSRESFADRFHPRATTTTSAFRWRSSRPIRCRISWCSKSARIIPVKSNCSRRWRCRTSRSLPTAAEHLEFLGDLMGVRRENAQIIEGLNPKGTLIVNGDDQELLQAIEGFPGQKITFGFNESNDLFATNIECGNDGVRFNLNKSRRTVFVPMLGKHNACNALAALAVARRMG